MSRVPQTAGRRCLYEGHGEGGGGGMGGGGTAGPWLRAVACPPLLGPCPHGCVRHWTELTARVPLGTGLAPGSPGAAPSARPAPRGLPSRHGGLGRTPGDGPESLSGAGGRERFRERWPSCLRPHTVSWAWSGTFCVFCDPCPGRRKPCARLCQTSGTATPVGSAASPGPGSAQAGRFLLLFVVVSHPHPRALPVGV